MDERQQWELTQDIASEIEKKVGAKVICEPVKESGNKFRYKTPNNNGPRKKNVFAWATIHSITGCLTVTTWERCLKYADFTKITRAEFKKNLQWKEDGYKWSIYQPNDDVCKEVVYALTIAYKYCQ